MDDSVGLQKKSEDSRHIKLLFYCIIHNNIISKWDLKNLEYGLNIVDLIPNVMPILWTAVKKHFICKILNYISNIFQLYIFERNSHSLHIVFDIEISQLGHHKLKLCCFTSACW